MSDVKDAIKRSKAIMLRNIEVGLKPQQYKGYKYYTDNPSITVHKSIEKILKDCEIM